MAVLSRPFLALFALVATLLSERSGSDNRGGSRGLPKEITIGAAIAKTGYMAPYDASIAAIEQLFEETNAQGGINGHRIKVVQVDTRSEPQQGAVAAQEAIERGADILLLSGEALTAAAGASVAEENGVLNFTLTANEPGFGPPTTGRLSFGANPSLLGEASAGATFLHRKGIEHPFVFRDTALIYGKANYSAFQQTWEKLGGAIAGSADFENSDESIASQIGELRNTGADAIVMCSYLPGGASAIRQIRAAGVRVPILAPSAFDGTKWLKGIPDTDDIYFTSNGSIYDPPDEEMAKLLKRLERTGIDPEITSSFLAAYAAGELILDAIEETHSVDGNLLADALEKRPHETIIGSITYTRKNHYPCRPWPVYVLSNGRPKLVDEVTPQFIPEYGG